MIKPPTSDQQQVEKAPVGQSAGAGLTQTDKVEGVEVQDVLDEIDALLAERETGKEERSGCGCWSGG